MSDDASRSQVEIRRWLAESDKFVAEQRKLMSEAAKLESERLKFGSEVRKFDRERVTTLVLALAAAFGAFVGFANTVGKLLGWPT